MSSATSVNEALTGYAAGRVTAEQLVGVVLAAYYGPGAQGLGPRERLRPLVEVIERAHPGVIELAATADRPGFAVRLIERPFPKHFETELHEAIRALRTDGPATGPQAPSPRPGLVARIVRAIRRVFSA